MTLEVDPYLTQLGDAAARAPPGRLRIIAAGHGTTGTHSLWIMLCAMGLNASHTRKLCRPAAAPGPCSGPGRAGAVVDLGVGTGVDVTVDVFATAPLGFNISAAWGPTECDEALPALGQTDDDAHGVGAAHFHELKVNVVPCGGETTCSRFVSRLAQAQAAAQLAGGGTTTPPARRQLVAVLHAEVAAMLRRVAEAGLSAVVDSPVFMFHDELRAAFPTAAVLLQVRCGGRV